MVCWLVCNFNFKLLIVTTVCDLFLFFYFIYVEYHSLVQAARVIVSRNGVVLIVRWVWKWKVRKREREGGRKAGTICPSLDQRLSYQQKHTRQRLVRRRFNGSHNTLIFICEYCHRLYYCMHYWTSLYSCLPPGLS